MSTCAQCGHELGTGRFCTNCGHPVAEPASDALDWRTDTVERPREAPAPPPPAGPRQESVAPAPVPDPPESPRFPLFADEAATPPSPAPPRQEPPHTHRHRRIGAAVLLPWLLGFLALALVAGLGAWLLLGGDDPAGTAQEPEPTADVGGAPPSEQSEKSDEPDEEADGGSEGSGTGKTPRGRPENLAPFVEVSAPAPARASTDTRGRTVRYVATNMLDDSSSTAWRMPGDGTGESIRFRFDGPVRLRAVGLINGYAKTASDSRGALDWYAGNRRVREVEWTFDDGTVLTQRLRDTHLMQNIRVDRVDTESVTLRLLRVSPPGPGRASRNYTAISGVRLQGAPLG